MVDERRPWTREETYKALALYLTLPYGKLHQRNPQIIALAAELNRSPGSVGFKLNNLASLDPAIIASGRKGASNTSRLDKEVWAEYEAMGLTLIEAALPATLAQEIAPSSLVTEKEVLVKQRVRQHLFRKMVLAAYDNRCCITSLSDPRLLVAGHIMTWAGNEDHRLDPSNGLCMNSLHDRAYECGLISITPDYELVVSKAVKERDNPFIQANFWQQDGLQINLPSRALPNRDWLNHHYQNRFIR